MSRVIVDSLIATVFAPVCVSCAQVLETPTRSPACERCWQNLRRYTPPWCSRCGAPLARADAPHECLPAGSAVRALRALGPYEGVLRDLLHALKFDRRRSLAAPLGSRLQSSADETLRRRRRAGPRAAPSMASVASWVQPGRRSGDRAARQRASDLAGRPSPPIDPAAVRAGCRPAARECSHGVRDRRVDTVAARALGRTHRRAARWSSWTM